MYNTHFGFTNTPFSLAPDTGQFVNLQGHQECFDLLVYALSTGEGFVKIIGDVGTGKTILCRKLIRYLEQPSRKNKGKKRKSPFKPVYIPNPLLSPIGLLRAIAHELGVLASDETERDALIKQVSDEMLVLADQDQSVVVIIDEAQALPEETLESLRLVTNLETETRKLVQVVLFGQTELESTLNKHEFRQLKQRITFSYQLEPLSQSSTEQYLNVRTMKVGFTGEPLFRGAAAKKMFMYSGGVPRLINVLAHKALLSAYSDGRKKVTAGDVKKAWQDGRSENSGINRGWLIAFTFLALIAAAISWAKWFGGLAGGAL